MKDPKNFEKIAVFKVHMTAGFLPRCQKSLQFFTPEMMHFQPWKKIFSPILCLSSWSNYNFSILSTSKWPSGPQFCERFLCSSQKNYQNWSKMAIYEPKIFWVFSSKIEKSGNRKICVLCCSFWSNQDLDMFSTSKWLSALMFCERLLCSWQKNDQKWS